jgi:hypothetical protein
LAARLGTLLAKAVQEMRMPQTSALARLAVLLVLAISASGCEVIGGIFKAGIWVGALGVVAIAVLVFVVIAKIKR